MKKKKKPNQAESGKFKPRKIGFGNNSPKIEVFFSKESAFKPKIVWYILTQVYLSQNGSLE